MELLPPVSALAHGSLKLTRSEIAQLTEAHQRALSASGRIELQTGLLTELTETFADSPYLSKEGRADVLCELTELLYALKNRTEDRISDETLLRIMRKNFDEPCRGSVEYLGDILERELT